MTLCCDDIICAWWCVCGGGGGGSARVILPKCHTCARAPESTERRGIEHRTQPMGQRGVHGASGPWALLYHSAWLLYLQWRVCKACYLQASEHQYEVACVAKHACQPKKRCKNGYVQRFLGLVPGGMSDKLGMYDGISLYSVGMRARAGWWRTCHEEIKGSEGVSVAKPGM